jgi:hypothetical protein
VQLRQRVGGDTAVIVAGLACSARGVRLLARDVRLAVDGRDYVAGIADIAS